MAPLVSIGMPVHNAAHTLEAALRSILNQTHTRWELLLIDDGSTDPTLEVAAGLADHRIRTIADGRNLGLATRLNQAVSLARGRYFARMDGDDIAYPERLALQVQYLEAHPRVDLLGGRVMIFEGSGRVVGTYPFRATHAELCARPWAGFYLPHPTWMGRMAWFRANPYREDFPKTQDQELLLRTHAHSCFACLPQFLVGYRKTALSLSTILAGRWFFSRALFSRAVVSRRPAAALRVAEQLAKALVDVVAIATGLNYRLLRHRAVPVDPAASERWEAVWRACHP